MTNSSQQRYRLTIGTCRAGTIFCIGAARDEEAISKASRIVQQFDADGGECHLERANGSLVPWTDGRGCAAEDAA